MQSEKEIEKSLEFEKGPLENLELTLEEKSKMEFMGGVKSTVKSLSKLEKGSMFESESDMESIAKQSLKIASKKSVKSELETDSGSELESGLKLKSRKKSLKKKLKRGAKKAAKSKFKMEKKSNPKIKLKKKSAKKSLKKFDNKSLNKSKNRKSIKPKNDREMDSVSELESELQLMSDVESVKKPLKKPMKSKYDLEKESKMGLMLSPESGSMSNSDQEMEWELESEKEFKPTGQKPLRTSIKKSSKKSDMSNFELESTPESERKSVKKSIKESKDKFIKQSDSNASLTKLPKLVDKSVKQPESEESDSSFTEIRCEKTPNLPEFDEVSEDTEEDDGYVQTTNLHDVQNLPNNAVWNGETAESEKGPEFPDNLELSPNLATDPKPMEANESTSKTATHGQTTSIKKKCKGTGRDSKKEQSEEKRDDISRYLGRKYSRRPRTAFQTKPEGPDQHIIGLRSDNTTTKVQFDPKGNNYNFLEEAIRDLQSESDKCDSECETSLKKRDLSDITKGDEEEEDDQSCMDLDELPIIGPTSTLEQLRQEAPVTTTPEETKNESKGDPPPREKTRINFCKICNNLTYPKEDKVNKALLQYCRNCNWTRKSQTYCVYENQLIKHENSLRNIPPAIISDPSLPRIPGECPECKNTQIAYIMQETGRSDRQLQVYFICTNPQCRYRWTIN